jgi:ABC-type multidrug transport system fused ATPase/permease subunit
MTRKLKGDINVSQLYLKYIPDAEPALAAIDLVINQGETVVICGHEGAGKSSLIKLISSLYAYQSGHISLDHVNIKQMQPVTLRKSLTFIPQYIQLFSGTLESNLRAFNPAATRDEMLWAIEKVGLSDEIEELTFGLDTMVTSQNRKQFSNSFVRLFFIAAALLRDTGIVIVDEGTKGLNKKDLKKVVEIFKELKETKTLVIIASQKPIFEIADKILWLDQGRVRKFGERDEIINEYFEVGV